MGGGGAGPRGLRFKLVPVAVVRLAGELFGSTVVDEGILSAVGSAGGRMSGDPRETV